MRAGLSTACLFAYGIIGSTFAGYSIADAAGNASSRAIFSGVNAKHGPRDGAQYFGTEGNAVETAKVAVHIDELVPPELREKFELFIYVSKAEQGPWAQHMFVFAKSRANADGPKMILMGDWPVSTGREKMERAKNGERMSTATPAGFYEFDPERFYPEYHSAQWDRDMPNAMFFNWANNGVSTGLAIHGVTDADQTAAIGKRASAGCVQLPLDASRKLFDLVRDNFEGEVPLFAYDEKTRSISNKGELERDKDGNLVMEMGYTALVIIEDYAGEGPSRPELAVDLVKPAG